jgi:hypothetical protein
MQPYASIYSHIQPYAAICKHTQPYTAIYSHMQPYASIYSHIQPYAAICKHTQPYTAIYSHMQPYTTIYSNIQPYTAIYTHMQPYTAIYSCKTAGILHSRGVRFNTIWHHTRIHRETSGGMPLANLRQKEQHGLKNEETQKHRETSSECVAQSDPERTQIESKCVLLPFSKFRVAGGNMMNLKRRKTRKITCGFRARGPCTRKTL